LDKARRVRRGRQVRRGLLDGFSAEAEGNGEEGGGVGRVRYGAGWVPGGGAGGFQVAGNDRAWRRWASVRRCVSRGGGGRGVWSGGALLEEREREHVGRPRKRRIRPKGIVKILI
jgi:hypothetical protein